MHKNNTNKLDDDIYTFTEDDLKLSSEELNLSKKLEKESEKNSIKFRNNSLIDLDDFDNYSAFKDFKITELENPEDDFQVEEQVYDELELESLMKTQVLNEPIKNKSEQDLSEMDFDTLDSYLNLSKDDSMIKETKIEPNELDAEESNYLDESLQTQLNEQSNEKEQLSEMDYSQLNDSLNMTEIKKENIVDEEKESFGSKMISKLADKFQKTDNPSADDEVILDLTKEETGEDVLNSQFNFDEFENTFDDSPNTKIEDFDSKKDDLLGDIDFDSLLETPVEPIISETNYHIEPLEKIKDKKDKQIKNEEKKLDDISEFIKDDALNVENTSDSTIENAVVQQEEILEPKIKKKKTKKEKSLSTKKEKKMEYKKINFVPIIATISIVALCMSGYAVVTTKSILSQNQNLLASYSDSSNQIQSVESKVNNLETNISDLNQKLSDLESVKTKESSWNEIIESKLSTIVTVLATTDTKNDSEQTSTTKNGSGIILDKTQNELVILTNDHVISNTNQITITFSNGSTVNGSIRKENVESDLATITVPLEKINEEVLNTIAIAQLQTDDNLKVGEDVLAIGNALGTGLTSTTGIISGKEKTIKTEEGKTLSNLIQTNAAINHGNSGGPLLDKSGNVIGICVAKAKDDDAEGIGFAIPIYKNNDIINSLK